MKLEQREVLCRYVGNTATVRTVLYHPKTRQQVAVITQIFVCKGLQKNSPGWHSIINPDPAEYMAYLQIPVDGPKGITLQGLSWNAMMRIAERESSFIGKVLNRLDCLLKSHLVARQKNLSLIFLFK